MKSQLNRFNRVAHFYDTLAGLIFGKGIRKAQTFFLPEVKPGSMIIVLGGGTGWILEELFRIQPDCNVLYIEASSSMISLAKKKNAEFQDRITFVHGTQDSIPAGAKADYVIANFFLDLFSPTSLKHAVEKIKSSLVSNGVLLVTDFVDSGKIWQKFLLKTMYAFFMIVGATEARQLPPWEIQLRNSGMDQFKSGFFFYGFIKSSLHKKVS